MKIEALTALLLLGQPEAPDLNSVLSDPLCPGATIGAPCREGCFKIEHFQDIGFFEGRVITLDADGKAQPLHHITFHQPTSNGGLSEVAIHVTRSGKFKHRIALDSHRYWQCKDGKTQLSLQQETVRFVLKAAGCSDVEVTYDPTWRARTLTLMCAQAASK